jgi:hypothetical protein
MRRSFFILTRAKLIALFFLIALLIALVVSLLLKPPPTKLMIGSEATVAEVSIPTYGAIDLNGFTPEQMAALRKDMLGRQPGLVDTYTPLPAIFDGLVSGGVWWSVAGVAYYRSGPKITQGPSYDSHFIVNPYHLIMPHFWSISRGVPAGKFNWDRKIATPELVDRGQVPLYTRPDSLVWKARESKAIDTYNVSAMLFLLRGWMQGEIAANDIIFELVAYNARDLGFNYAYIPPDQIKNITIPKPPSKLLTINDHFTHDKSCDPQGNCNRSVRSMNEYRVLKIVSLPAEFPVRLWKDMPASINDAPDFEYLIKFE